MIELAIIEEHVRVRVSCDRKRTLPNAGADERPRLTLTVPEADSPVAQVVR